jgi:Flp pilus assembly protein TadG
MAEFAIVFPVFILFIFGLIDVGRRLMVSNLVFNAARASCRVGTLPGNSNTQVQNVVDNFLQPLALSGYTTTIRVNGSTTMDVSAANTKDAISVTVSVPASSVSWLPTMYFTDIPITGQFTLSHE